MQASAARDAHLAQLARGGAAVVATGQQVGLFLGPLYAIYKAASAIAIARALAAEAGTPCVPLFWLQTEDHDFAEMKRCVVPREHDRPLALELREEALRDRCSLGDRALGAEVPALLEQLAAALGDAPHAAEVVALLRAGYQPGVSPGEAFARTMAALFAEEGLVVLDPRCAAAARLAAPLVRRALVESTRIDGLLAARGEALRAAGFDEQIAPRPGSPLPFFHPRGARGPRYRMLRRGDEYEVQGSGERLTKAELLALLEREPLRFSSSALLRPLIQDALLPTAVYVGGPAEVRYLAQLPPLYAELGVEQPLVAERAHLLLTTAPLRRLLDKLGIAAAELARPRAELLARLTRGTPDGSLAQADRAFGDGPPGVAWAAELDARLARLQESARDPSLEKAARRLQASVRGALTRLGARSARAALERDSLLAGRLERLDAWLRPGGEMQERVHSFPAFAARVGLAEFRRAIFSAIDPLRPALRELAL